MISIFNFIQINYVSNVFSFDLRLFLIIIINFIGIFIQIKNNKSIAIFNLTSTLQLILIELYFNFIVKATNPEIILMRFYIIFICFLITILQ